MEECKYVIVPEYQSGFGTGHVRRAVHLARDLPLSYIYLPKEELRSWEETIPGLLETNHGTDIPQGPLVIIYDKPIMKESEVLFWKSQGSLLGMDVRGPLTKHCTYIVDTLPRLPSKDFGSPNCSSRSFLDLPPRVKHPSRQVHTIVVSFGGEDKRQQTLSLYKSGILQANFPDAKVSWVRASRMIDHELPGWQKIDSPHELQSIIPKHDLFIGFFGLTAYEALASGTMVMLWNPTDYHEALSAMDGFVTLGAGRKPRFHVGRDQSVAKAYAHARDTKFSTLSLADHIKGLSLGDVLTCSACRSTQTEVLERFDHRSYHRCRVCGMVSMSLFTPQNQDYGEAYFFEAYEEQYGKTYLQDFDHIRSMGIQRLKHIASINKVPGRLLDIGCAYGPFLHAAASKGYQVQGIDISSHAVEYCVSTLGFSAQVADIAKASAASIHGGEPFDVVTLWYVIEHFPDLASILEKIRDLVCPGGILALSTPSMEGISSLKNVRDFLDKSPGDHYSVWSPSTIKKVLAIHGFDLIKLRGTGHHPERFPGILSSPLLRPLTLLISKVFFLGDTFELYARRRGGKG